MSVVIGEQMRGMMTSVVASAAVAIATYRFANSGPYALPAVIASGHVLGYCLDIIFAKHTFQMGNVAVHIPYSSVSRRIGLLVRSMISLSTARFAVSVIIDTIVSSAIYRMAKRYLRTTWLGSSRLGNVVLQAGVAAMTYTAYVSFQRFSWAYKDTVTNLGLDGLMVLWLAALVLVRAVFPSDAMTAIVALVFTSLMHMRGSG
jgi:hypothetical protein